MSWKRGVKSLYYFRGLSIQRADSVSEKAVRPDEMATAAPSDAGRMLLAGAAKPNNYGECLACQ